LVRHGDCVEVVDGDTLRVATHPALAYSFPVVRCARIDAPEMQGEYQGVASQALALALASGSTRRGTIAIYGSDEYGRVVADVNLQGLGSLGAVMQAAGLASWYPPSFGLGLFPGEDKHLQILTAS
jgi:endonuclease YncB( thermonuclease family)